MTESSLACLILLKESDIDGSKVPDTIQIPEKCNIIIGRGAPGLSVTVALSVLEKGREIISRQHATISCSPNNDCIIKDLGSANGVFVNNIKIEEHTLVDGDIVQFGGASKIPVGKKLSRPSACVKYRFFYVAKKMITKGDTISYQDRNGSSSTSIKKSKKRSSSPTTSISSEISNSSLRSNRTNSTSSRRTSHGQHGGHHQYVPIEPSTERKIDTHLLKNKIRDMEGELHQFKNDQSARNGDSAIIDNTTTATTGKHPQDKIISKGRVHSNLKKGSKEESSSNESVVLIDKAMVDKSINPSPLKIPRLNGNSPFEENRDSSLQINRYSAPDGTSVVVINRVPSHGSQNSTHLFNEHQHQHQHHVQNISPAIFASPSGLVTNSMNSLLLHTPAVENSGLENKPGKSSHSSVITSTHSTPRYDGSLDGHTSVAHANKSHTELTKAKIDVSALYQHVQCLLCNHFVLDAVVCKCSHSFCWACLERHMHGAKSTCPICNDEPFYAINGKPIQGRIVPYFRSQNLDNIVWLLQEAEGITSIESFRQREQQHMQILKGYGIDVFKCNPHILPALDNSDESKSVGNGHGNIALTNPNASKGQIATTTQSIASHSHGASKSVQSVQGRPVLGIAANSWMGSVRVPLTSIENLNARKALDGTSKNFYDEKSYIELAADEEEDDDVMICEGCGEKGHDLKICPHKSNFSRQSLRSGREEFVSKYGDRDSWLDD